MLKKGLDFLLCISLNSVVTQIQVLLLDPEHELFVFLPGA